MFQFSRSSLPGCWTNRELTYLTSLTQRCFLEMWVFSIFLFVCLFCHRPLFVLYFWVTLLLSLCCRALWWLRWILVSLITFWLSSSGRHYSNWATTEHFGPYLVLVICCAAHIENSPLAVIINMCKLYKPCCCCTVVAHFDFDHFDVFGKSFVSIKQLAQIFL